MKIGDSVGKKVIKSREIIEDKLKIEEDLKARAIDHRYGQTHRKRK